MLELYIPPNKREYWDSVNREFIYKDPFPGMTIQLEHSLYAISKWEMKFKKAYLSKEPKTPEETFYYIKCMTLTENVPDEVYECLTDENIRQISSYIEDSMSATKPRRNQHKDKSNEIMTSEVIYCMMVLAQVPFECQYWHLSRLMILLECIGIKQSPPKKMGKNDLMRRNSQLNAARRAKMKSKG
jgi:hypothetical protein